MSDYKVVSIGISNATGFNNLIIGVGNLCTHNNCVLIGHNLKSDHDYQMKIGNVVVSVTRDMTEDEYQEIATTIKALHGGYR